MVTTREALARELDDYLTRSGFSSTPGASISEVRMSTCAPSAADLSMRSEAAAAAAELLDAMNTEPQPRPRSGSAAARLTEARREASEARAASLRASAAPPAAAPPVDFASELIAGLEIAPRQAGRKPYTAANVAIGRKVRRQCRAGIEQALRDFDAAVEPYWTVANEASANTSV